MRIVRKKHNPNLLWYQLGELSVNCPKVNYKLNYKPGTLICPRTNQLVPFEQAKEKVRHYSRLPIEFKKTHLKNISLVDLPHGEQTHSEMIAAILEADTS